MNWELCTSGKIKRYIASREASAAGFTVCGIAKDHRWIRAIAPDGTRVVLFRVGAAKWHSFYWDHEATGSGHNPLMAMEGGLGDVIDTDAQCRAYETQVLAAPTCYATDCAGLYIASVQAYNR